MVNGLYGLGKDDELRQALAQQQAALDALKAQQAANVEGFKLSKHDALRIGILIMAIMLVFK